MNLGAGEGPSEDAIQQWPTTWFHVISSHGAMSGATFMKRYLIFMRELRIHQSKGLIWKGLKSSTSMTYCRDMNQATEYRHTAEKISVWNFVVVLVVVVIVFVVVVTIIIVVDVVVVFVKIIRGDRMSCGHSRHSLPKVKMFQLIKARGLKATKSLTTNVKS